MDVEVRPHPDEVERYRLQGRMVPTSSLSLLDSPSIIGTRPYAA